MPLFGIPLICELIPAPISWKWTQPNSWKRAWKQNWKWKKAYTFHRIQKWLDPNLKPRSKAKIREFAQAGRLFGIRGGKYSRSYFGLCYVNLTQEHSDKKQPEWEVGGVSVAKSAQGSRIGPLLTRVATAHATVLNYSPERNNLPIIALVRVSNCRAERMFKQLGFRYDRIITRPPPPIGRGNAKKFIFTNAITLRRLAQWFQAFDGSLPKLPNEVRVQIDLGPLIPDLESLRNALIEEVQMKRGATQLAGLEKIIVRGLLNIHHDTRNTLLSKLQDAQQELRESDKEDACEELEDFANYAQAQSGSNLTPGQATQLKGYANRIRNVLEC